MSARNLALEALYAWHDATTNQEKREAKVLGRKAISALEAETGEPVAWIDPCDLAVLTCPDVEEFGAMRYAGVSGAQNSKSTTPLYTAPPPAGEPVAWGRMTRQDGLILDVICPKEHARYAGAYTIPLYTAQLPAVPQGWQLVTICMLKQVTEALAARLGTNADEWPLVLSARNIIEDFE